MGLLSFNISASSSTPAGKYSIALSAVGSDGSTTSLNPITIIVNGSPLSDAKAITEFSIESVNAIICGQNITLALPTATDVTALVATYETTGASASVDGVLQEDGVTPNDFTSPVEYVVHAADGTEAAYTVTVAVLPPRDTNGRIVTAARHACMLESNQLAYCWGLNTYGELGNGTQTNSNVPVAVMVGGAGAIPDGSTFTAISTADSDFSSAGYGVSCAIVSNGLAYCWGNNYYG